MRKPILLTLLLAFSLVSCHRAPSYLEPRIPSPSHPKEIERKEGIRQPLSADFSSCPFAPLTDEEKGQEWGKELQIGYAFAKDFDLYRAITTFKRALILSPEGPRKREIEYAILLAYFLGKKAQEVVYTFETTLLSCVDSAFPAFLDLLLILYDSYLELGHVAKAEHILNMLGEGCPQVAEKLRLLDAVQTADIATLNEKGETTPYLGKITERYCCERKSIRKAETLNALLPGAGYWYIGQKQTAITAFLINSLFIGAAAHFIADGNGAAAAITLSLESGWYFGGILGAGLGAKYYNERLFEGYAQKIVEKEKCYPMMMLKFSF